jgi:hypothetical protein
MLTPVRATDRRHHAWPVDSFEGLTWNDPAKLS